MIILAAKNADREIRAGSSSGGVFSLIAEEVISEGGVVYGAAFNEEWNVVHKRADDFADLARLRGSKYVYSSVGEVYSQAMADLDAGRKVMFSGTPCQVAAMRKRAGNRSNLLLVEIVCHGAPEAHYWDRYLTELLALHRKSHAQIQSISFRDKRNGWKRYNFTVRFADGTEITEFHGQNAFMRGFLKNLTLRSACFRCPFKYPAGSQADITLGDFWGVEKLEQTGDEDLLAGISLVIGRTPRGEEAVGRIDGNGYRFDEINGLNPALTHPAHMASGYLKFKKKAERTDNLTRLLDRFTREPLSIRVKVAIAGLMKTIVKGRR